MSVSHMAAASWSFCLRFIASMRSSMVSLRPLLCGRIADRPGSDGRVGETFSITMTLSDKPYVGWVSCLRADNLEGVKRLLGGLRGRNATQRFITERGNWWYCLIFTLFLF